jgi:hypothetical protein
VAKVAYRQGLATVPEPEDIVTFVREEVFEPLYPRYV